MRYCVVLAGIGVVYLFGAMSREASADSLSEVLGNRYALDDESVHIVVVEIREHAFPDNRGDDQIRLPTLISYRARVLAECRERHVGDVVEIRGTVGTERKQPRDHLPLPTFESGSTVLLVVRSTEHAKRFVSLGRGTLPIGIRYPVCVPRADVDALSSVLPQYQRWDVTGERDPQRNEEIGPLLTSDNYYEWALGATHVSVRGTAEQRAELLQLFGESSSPLRRILWLDHLAQEVFPRDDRPRLAQLHRWLTDYLQSRNGLAVGADCEPQK